MSNRGHTRSERLACRPLLVWLLETLQPRIVVAIGRDAHSALKDLGVTSTTVRHPSYGGQGEFTAGLYDLYGVSTAGERQPALQLLNGTYAAGRRAAQA